LLNQSKYNTFKPWRVEIRINKLNPSKYYASWPTGYKFAVVMHVSGYDAFFSRI